MTYTVITYGRTNWSITFDTLSEVREAVAGFKKLNTISLIRVFTPNCSVRTIAFENGYWRGSI
jgi:hypothetical protein